MKNLLIMIVLIIIASCGKQTETVEITKTIEVQSENSYSMIDPCGDNPEKFDEILVKTADGKFLAYFEFNGKRFLTELTDGNYITTDEQACRFSIVNGELVYN